MNWLLWLETQQFKYILLTDLWPALVSKWTPQGHSFKLTKQYVQMTARRTYTDQRNESIPTVTSHVAFLTPLEVTWRHLNWSQNTFRSIRENIIWSWNPFSKDVLQNVDLTLFFSPPIFLSHQSQSSARKPSNPDREEKSTEEEMKITWAQTDTISNLLLQNVMPLFCPPPPWFSKVMSQFGLSASRSAWLLEALLRCWHCGSLNCDCCS